MKKPEEAFLLHGRSKIEANAKMMGQLSRGQKGKIFPPYEKAKETLITQVLQRLEMSEAGHINHMVVTHI